MVAADLLHSIDPSIDPCEDFHNFACGKFHIETPLTDDKLWVDTSSITNKKIQSQLLQLFDQPVVTTDLKYDDVDGI